MRLNVVGRFVSLAAVAAFVIAGFAPSAKAWHVKVHNPSPFMLAQLLQLRLGYPGTL